MTTKTPITYGKLGKRRAQTQAAPRAPQEDDIDLDPIDFIPSPTRSPRRKASRFDNAATSPRLRSARHELTRKRPTTPTKKPAAVHPSIDTPPSQAASSRIREASSSSHKVRPFKRSGPGSQDSSANVSSNKNAHTNKKPKLDDTSTSVGTLIPSRQKLVAELVILCRSIGSRTRTRQIQCPTLFDEATTTGIRP